MIERLDQTRPAKFKLNKCTYTLLFPFPMQDIFIKMMDFIRNYDPGSDEYTRRIRFIGHDSASNELARKILEIGDIKIHDPKPTRDGGMDDDIPIRSSGLARSKSDHRLVAEFRRREEAGSPPSRRRFGESRYSREDNKSRSNFGRYGLLFLSYSLSDTTMVPPW